jgi:hypothetical protein
MKKGSGLEYNFKYFNLTNFISFYYEKFHTFTYLSYL